MDDTSHTTQKKNNYIQEKKIFFTAGRDNAVDE
jgi:hypothetical protein